MAINSISELSPAPRPLLSRPVAGLQCDRAVVAEFSYRMRRLSNGWRRIPEVDRQCVLYRWPWINGISAGQAGMFTRLLCKFTGSASLPAAVFRVCQFVESWFLLGLFLVGVLTYSDQRTRSFFLTLVWNSVIAQWSFCIWGHSARRVIAIGMIMSSVSPSVCPFVYLYNACIVAKQYILQHRNRKCRPRNTILQLYGSIRSNSPPLAP